MAVYSATAAGRQWRDVGLLAAAGLGWVLFATGWLLARLLRGVAVSVAGLLFGAGWAGRRAVWPALCWCGRATRLGWQEGARPIGGRRGPA